MNADGANNDAARIWRLDAQIPNKDRGWGPVIYNNNGTRRVIIDGVVYEGSGVITTVGIMGFWIGVGGVSSGQTHQWVQIGIITTFNAHPEHIGKLVRRFRSEGMNSGHNGENWVIIG